MIGLQVRDRELLRTLARLHYASTSELVGAFFPSADGARRRLKRLSEAGLIRSQSREIAEGLTYHAWRLTPSGIEVVSSRFPEEPGLEGLAERVSNGRLLINLKHHETVGQIYFQLLRGRDSSPPREADRTAVEAYWRRIRDRAATLRWATDGTVMLRWQTVKGNQELQPDATVWSPTGRHRVFIEVDRSTHPAPKVRASLERYRSYFSDGYARSWPDGLQPVVLLVCKSEERRRNLQPLFDRPFLTGTARMRLVDEAVKDLHKNFFPAPAEAGGAAAAAAPADTTADAATHLYNEMRTYRAALRAKGDDLPASALDALLRVRKALSKEDTHARQG